MQIIHLSAECYPVAKTGGLGDVVGALPKYQNKIDGVDAKVVMPYVYNDFTANKNFELDFRTHMPFGKRYLNVNIWKCNDFSYDLYLVEIEGFSHRTEVYGYGDDYLYFIAFQTATLNWIHQWEVLPDVIHCHDFHTGFVPFMMKHGYQYPNLRNIPSFFTIHNGKYQGQMAWDLVDYLPWFDTWKTNLLEWNNTVNPMACAIRNAWAVNTVSPQYMKELMEDAYGLEKLFQIEHAKCYGILNGIDAVEWDPKTDNHLNHHYNARNVKTGKQKNKEEICELFQLDPSLPLFSFVGRFTDQKGVDVLGDGIWNALYNHNLNAAFLVMGSGDRNLEDGVNRMKLFLPKDQYNTYIGYNEQIARKIYAASDFLIMPSRFEPCGLNQFYALHYGTIPIVRTVGGLLDSVIDIEDEGGNGIRFIQLSKEDLLHAFNRAVALHQNSAQLQKLRKNNMKMDFSWEKSAQQYIQLYKKFTP